MELHEAQEHGMGETGKCVSQTERRIPCPYEAPTFTCGCRRRASALIVSFSPTDCVLVAAHQCGSGRPPPPLQSDARLRRGSSLPSPLLPSSTTAALSALAVASRGPCPLPTLWSVPLRPPPQPGEAATSRHKLTKGPPQGREDNYLHFLLHP